MHVTFDTVRNILAVIGAGCVLCTLVILLICFIAHFRKD
jgi:hypothetical protein